MIFLVLLRKLNLQPGHGFFLLPACNMRINRCSLYGRMSQQLLHSTQIRPLAQQHCGKGVTQLMAGVR